MDPEALHRQLLDPATYPEPTRHVDYRETHISRVYLTDSHAYKLKKPLKLGFLDYSTLDRREFFCAEEVRLNRRFAPDTYLGVATLNADHGMLRFNGKGPLIDYAVRMRRLPDDRMLDTLVERNAPDLPGEIARLAGHLAALFAALPPCRGGADGHAADVRANCEENLAQTLPVIGKPLSSEAHRLMAARTESELARLVPLFAAREAAGFVRDGHGDLHARNICMTDPVRVYDCIEFCRRFRVDDVAAELAFLLMDLEFRGRRDLAETFLARYRECAADPDLAALLPFYKSYRAWVRGKVEALLSGETDAAPATRAAAGERAAKYFNLALGYYVQPVLLLTAGLMGVGKSTLARALAETLGARLLRSDVIRKELAGLHRGRAQPDAFGAGLYAPAATARTYAEMQRQVETLLHRGCSVVVDASFARDADRQAFFALAAACGVPAWLLHLQCARDLALNRLDRRQAEGGDPSDGRRALFAPQAALFEPVAAGPRVIAIDSSADVNYNVQKIACRLLAGRDYP
ncbi:MAG: kinase [Deltaproteobacteria bacterium]|nr:MAG: kinase [Deltaproteobacteria bacterium]